MKALKRTIAAIMSLVIVGGAAPIIPGGFTALKPVVASAEEGSLSFDEKTGTLSLSGSITKAQLDEYRADPKVKHIVADSTVTLPDSCKNFFTGMMAEDIDLSAVDCDNVKDISNMISYCQNLKTVDLGGIDLSSIEHANYAFYWNPKLETIYVYRGGIMSYILNESEL